MREHKLRTWPSYFAAALSGEKPFEVRWNDRGYAVGDVARLEEWDPSPLVGGMSKGYTGRYVRRVISYVLHGGQFGIEKGYVVLGLAEETETATEKP